MIGPVTAPQLFGTKAEASAAGIVCSRRRRVHETGIRGIIAASVALSVCGAGTARCGKMSRRRISQRAKETWQEK